MPKTVDVVISYATTADAEVFFHGNPPYRLQAHVAKVGNSYLGMGGLYYLNNSRVAFLILTEEGKKYPVTLCRWVKKWLKGIQDAGVPTINAIADPAIPTAPAFLKHFGFVPVLINDQILYQWSRKN